MLPVIHRRAQIYEHVDGAIDARFPYDEAVIDELKKRIAPRLRSYDPDTKTWRFQPNVAPVATKIILDRFTDAILTGWDTQPLHETLPLFPDDES